MHERLMGAVAVVSCALAAAAVAHHTFAGFDTSAEAELVVEGVVKRWEFSNPHTVLTVTVANSDGTTTDWSFEGAAVPALLQRGIEHDTYKMGERVRIVAGPIRDGRPVGILKFVQHADGSFTLPNDNGDIGREALERWHSRHP